MDGKLETGVCVCERVQEVLTRKQKLGAAAHLRWVIFVSLRMAASVVTPLSPMPLLLRLRVRGKMETVRE